MLEALQDRGSLARAVLEMQQKCEAQQVEIVEVKSGLKHLEAAAAQQSQHVQQLCEQLGRLDVPGALAELKSFISGPRGPTRVRDSTSQTSPPRSQSLSPAPQAQDQPASGEPAAGRVLGLGDVWGEGAKRAALPEEAGGEGKRSRGVRDKATQTNSKSALTPKTSSENCGASTPGLVAPGASQLMSLDVNNFVTSPKRPAKAVCSGDPGERGPGEHRRGGQPPPRSTRRGRPPGRRQAQPRSKACAFRPPCLPPPLPEPQEARAQPPRRGCLGRNPPQPAQGGALRPRTAKAAPRALRQLSGPSSQHRSQRSDSSQGDPRMRWFSDLTPESSQAPQAQQPGTPVLYCLGFDSSDDESC